jgi:hypothetical protein
MIPGKKYFFGIGVASYEQHDGLIRTVTNLIDIQEELAKKNIFMPIYVSDNNSANFPRDQFQSLKSSADIRLTLQKENLGFAGNLSFLLSTIDADFIMILGCGEILVQNALEELILHLMESDPEKSQLLGGTIGNIDDSSLNGKFFFESPNLLAVNRAISLNVWCSRYLDKDLLSTNRKNSWPHVELVVDIHNRHPYGSYFYFQKQVVVLDQPIHGWHNSRDFLRLILQLDKIVCGTKGVNLGPSIVECWRPIGSWIYYFRRSKNEPVHFLDLLRVLSRLLQKPHAVAYLVVMSSAPKWLIRFLSRISRRTLAAFTP